MKKYVFSPKPKGVVIELLRFPYQKYQRLRKKISIADDNFNPLSIGMPDVVLSKEKLLSLALKESVKTTLRRKLFKGKVTFLMNCYVTISAIAMLL